jgi:uncharacterized protein involved in exopolysaccharide biosynthesis
MIPPSPTTLSASEEALTRFRPNRLAPAYLPQEVPEQVLSFGHYAWLMRRHWGKITLAVLTCTTLATIIAFTLTPIYESTARIAIDLRAPASVIGDSYAAGESSGTEADQVFNTELQFILSDTVLRPVAERYHLGSAINLGRLPSGVRPFDIPVYLKGLSVVHPANSYLINVSFRSPDSVRAAVIANAVAHAYIDASLEMRARSSMKESLFIEKQMSELKKNMDDSATYLASYEKQLGVVDPDQKTSILAARLLQLNSQYTDAQNDRILKETEFRALTTGSLAALEVSPQAAALARLEETLHSDEEKMAAAKAIYGPNYAEYKRAENELNEVTREYNAMQAEIGKRIQVEYDEAKHREGMLRASLLETKAESDSLNAQSLEYQELKRQAETNRSLYNELLRKVKEAAINGAFQGSAIRIVDEARPQLHPVFPNKTVFISLGCLFSFALSAAGVILWDMSDRTLRDPDEARRAIGVEVLGILPHVHKFESLSPSKALTIQGATLTRQHRNDWFATADCYEDAIHALLASVLDIDHGKFIRSILFTSAIPGEGKSSCAAYMAAAHARKGFKTLLIDTDLRCPSQQSCFHLPNHPGLADAILRNLALSAIR